MSAVFIDTSALYALFVPVDTKHRVASATLLELGRERTPLLTTDLVLFESYILVHARTGRVGLLRFRNIVAKTPWLECIVTTPEHQAEAWRLIEQRTDKEYSFVDAASFVVMRALGIERAFTFDADFFREGFETLEGSSKRR
jgi:predicted nucleic acid-binding protein